ncbi:MAG: hypothetical protein HOG68_08105 [Candidatus Marinimicrobia bacterium]|jgi:Tol biopolymer transport system component|nr:hypothetical protein [Candidatus Neomarinimicrobiota bacterium]MBT3692331.1 hypothetical protein [Candidatus Neomarinimicrobiota bacterium]MBT4145099.1 hypothetical protein [Candidatus Neomarinimicrobiota bacterium]MBT4178057.1 hypothetical protein [Candidatus Neomarinimicrobiota bacterium]MBT5069614.1 hypothetical protein [Candidatus Neomarinimicrobiota bacterium]
MKEIRHIKLFIISILFLLISISAQGLPLRQIGQSIALETNGQFINPIFSPNGKYLVITEQNYTGIYLYHIESRTLHKITSDPSAGFGMNWSANSEWILSKPAMFMGKRRYNSIVTYHIRNGRKNVIFENQAFLQGIPEWRNQDNSIILNGGRKLKIFASTLTNNDSNEGKIIYSIGNSIVEYDLKTKIKKNLFSGEGDILNLKRSPDRKKLIFEVVGGKLWVLEIAKLKLTNLGIGHEPAWNPESNKIVYMQTEDDGYRITSSDIFVIHIDGTNRMNLTQTADRTEMRPDWHPNGEWIIYDLDGLDPIYMQKVE